MEVPSISSSSYASNTITGNQLFIDQQAQNLGVIGNIGKAQILQQFQALKEQVMTARIVKVYIADSNDNLPLERRVLYTGTEKLTDLTDQELFFEVPINDLLKAHNDYRKTVVDKKQAEKFGREIFLESARIRDLKMVVVSVASF